MLQPPLVAVLPENERKNGVAMAQFGDVAEVETINGDITVMFLRLVAVFNLGEPVEIAEVLILRGSTRFEGLRKGAGDTGPVKVHSRETTWVCQPR